MTATSDDGRARATTASARRRGAAARAASLAVIAVLAITTSVACSASDTGSEAAQEAAPPGTTVGTTEPPGPEIFTGADDDFYVVPDPLPPGQPGDLIRVQALGATDDRASVKVMYHSRDAEDRDRAVTGVVTYPTDPAPEGGWPVIATAHGTAGIGTQCAPSRTQHEAPGWGVPGVWVMTDYIGLGPIGEVHPYLSKSAEGDAVIDSVRAVRQLPEANASARWLSVGHSQGGHGALSAAELASTYAPELDLLGTVALAPGAMFDRVYGGIDPIVTNVLMVMALYGATSEHPDLDVADYVTPETQTAASVFATGCLAEITDALVPVAIAGPFTVDPRQTEPAKSMLLANDVGTVAVAGVPLYLASGTVDDRVVIDRVRDLFDRLCASGQVTELTIVEGADHGGIIPATSNQVTAFLEDRLAGRAPVDSCPGTTGGAA